MQHSHKTCNHHDHLDHSAEFNATASHRITQVLHIKLKASSAKLRGKFDLGHKVAQLHKVAPVQALSLMEAAGQIGT